MKKNPRNKIFIAICILLLIIVGFYREFLFYNIKAETMFQTGQHFDNFTDSSLTWLSNMNLKQIYWLRWELTFIFSFSFGLLSLAVIHFRFKSKKYNKWVIITFFSSFLLAAIFFLAFPQYNQDNFAYIVARQIMGFVQSPLLLMILFPIILLDRNSTK